MAEAHERKVRLIRARDWEILRTTWLDNVPRISPPGAPPQLLLHELTDLESALKKLAPLASVELPAPVPGLRPGLLHEGVFLMHKAAHVLGSALVHVSQGMCTWSASSAYQAAFFGMKAVSSMLGVTMVECGNRHFLIDAWAAPKRPKRNARAITILANTDRNEQRHLWAYFQRTLSKTANHEPLCGKHVRSLLLQNDFKDFARQRNTLHYRTNAWGLGDLHQCVIQDRFGRMQDKTIEPGQQDFSLVLAFGIIQMGRKMLSQLAEQSAVIRGELALVDRWLELPFNELYRSSVLPNAPQAADPVA
jgi:hypothetical protein